MGKLRKGNIDISTVVYLLFIIEFGVKPLVEIISDIFKIKKVNLNIVILLIIFLILLIKFKNTKVIKINNYFSLCIFILIISIFSIEIYSGINFYYSGNDELISYFYSFITNQFLLIFLLYFIGYNMKYFIDDFNTKKNNYVFTLKFIYILQIILFLYFQIIVRGYITNINYIYLGDMFSIFSLLLISCMNKERHKIILFTITTIILIIVGSRSSMLFFLINFMLYIARIFKKGNIITKFILSISFVIISYVTLIFQNSQQMISNRMLKVFSFQGFTTDYSFVERNLLLSQGLINIRNNWVLGDFFSEYTKRSGWGLYIHNILSYFEEYGVFIFTLVAILCVYILFNTVKNYFLYKDNKYIEFCTYISVFIILSTIFTRAYCYYYIWLAFGLINRQIISENIKYETYTNSKCGEEML